MSARRHRQHDWLPAELTQTTREIQRPMNATAAVQRRVMERNHQDSVHTIWLNVHTAISS